MLVHLGFGEGSLQVTDCCLLIVSSCGGKRSKLFQGRGQGFSFIRTLISPVRALPARPHDQLKAPCSDTIKLGVRTLTHAVCNTGKLLSKGIVDHFTFPFASRRVPSIDPHPP